jgi:nucleoside-diphosphate-sugar epimerase
MNLLSDDLDYILEKTGTAFSDLKGARIFITGGTGFIGIWLLEAIAWANQHVDTDIHVLVLCRNPSEMLKKAPHLMDNPHINFLQGDVRSFDFPQEKFTHIIHAATSASAQLNTESPLEMLDTIILGARRVLDFTVECGASTFLQLSSCAVYGRQPPEMDTVEESYMGAPDVTDLWSAYGEGKRMSEFLGAIYANKNNFKHKIARISSVVGPYMPLDIHFAIGNFIRNALDGGDIIIKGDGRPYRANLYITDAVIWLLTILLRGENNRPYNVGSDVGISLKETAEAVCKVSGRNQCVIVQQENSSNDLPPRYVASIKRCRDELDLDQWIDLNVAIKKTITWHKLYAPKELS